jgi:hypothetical protein
VLASLRFCRPPHPSRECAAQPARAAFPSRRLARVRRAPLLPALACGLSLSALAPRPVAAQARPGDLVGVVVNAQTRGPIEGAVITLRFTAKSARTDSAGRFQLLGVGAGAGLLEVRALGYRMLSQGVKLAEGETFADTLEMEPVAIELPEVLVEAPANNDWRSPAAFDHRRAKGGGYFITEEQIRQQHPLSLADLLRTVPGVTTACNYFGCHVWMNRTARACAPEYYLDGYPATFATGPNFPIQAIRGIEIYPDAFSAPIELQRLELRCGVIAIWTNMGR